MSKIINSFKKILNFLPPKRKSQFWIILTGMICMSIFETIVLGSIAFFASAISDPEKIIQSDYIVFVIDLLDIEWLSDYSTLITCVSIVVVLLVAAKNLIQAIVNYWSIRYSALIEGILAGNLLHGFLQMPYEWHLDQNSADLILVSANWRSYIGRSFINNVLQSIADLLLVTIMLTTLFIVQPMVSTIVLTILGTTSIILFTTVRRKLDRVAKQARDYEQSINTQATKMIHGFKDVKISGKQEIFSTQYNKTLFQISKIQGTQRLISGLPNWLLETIGFFMISFSICYMLFFLDYSIARISGTITLLAVTAWRVLPALNRILNRLASMRTVIPYIEKILDYYIETEENKSINNRSNTSNIQEKIDYNNYIQLQNLSFAYKNSNRFALEDVSLTIKKGDVVGIIGASGAGKSTFVDIITGLLVPSLGEMFIDDLLLNSYPLRMLWMTKLGYVPQTPYIFDGTIAENVAFEIDMSKIDKESVIKCCQMAAMDDFLYDLSLGVDSYIGERGVRLSGGQRQRVSIARALYQKPELIVFDEATSALDNKNEKAIQETIYSLRGKQTMIIVAHRLTTVESCDIIYEFEYGKLKRYGSPEVILNS